MPDRPGLEREGSLTVDGQRAGVARAVPGQETEHVACDLCGADQPVLLFEQRDIRFGCAEPVFQIVRCAVCDLIYLTPRPAPQAIGRHYPRAYYELERPPKARGRFGMWVRRVKAAIRNGVLQEFYGYRGGGDGPGARSAWTPLWKALLYGERLRLRLRGKAATIIPFVPGGRLLDVGCGSGELLQRLVALGWEGWGVEISPEAARYAREQRGLQVLQGDLPGGGFPAAKFDMVVFSHSLEHMFSPTTTLREANRLLRRGGRLFIAVPDASSLEARLFGRWWLGWDLPRHLYHFTLKTLTQSLERAGFHVLKRGWDAGTMHFIGSLRNLSKHKLGRELQSVEFLEPLVGFLTLALAHLRMGSTILLHAEKIEDCLVGPARVNRRGETTLSGRS